MKLQLPSTNVRVSFLDAMAELVAEGRAGADDQSTLANEVRRFGATWHTPEGFAEYVRLLRAESLPDTPRPNGYVPYTTWWLIDGDEYLARINVRHRLTPHLLEDSGHIGYHVRPSARRRGHATAMLRAVLPEARALGLDRALLTCNHDNVGSIKVIEACGGVLEDQRGDKLRYWIAMKAV